MPGGKRTHGSVRATLLALRSKRLTALNHATFRQHGEFTARQSQLVAEDFRVVLADERRPSGNSPGRAVIDRGLAWVDEAAAEFRVLCEAHGGPDSLVVKSV